MFLIFISWQMSSSLHIFIHLVKISTFYSFICSFIILSILVNLYVICSFLCEFVWAFWTINQQILGKHCRYKDHSAHYKNTMLTYFSLNVTLFFHQCPQSFYEHDRWMLLCWQDNQPIKAMWMSNLHNALGTFENKASLWKANVW